MPVLTDSKSYTQASTITDLPEAGQLLFQIADAF
jgi:hypothetical protein